jgi:hypothetical protein
MEFIITVFNVSIFISQNYIIVKRNNFKTFGLKDMKRIFYQIELNFNTRRVQLVRGCLSL